MNRVTGTYDVYGKYSKEFRILEDKLFKIAKLYNYDYIKTPIIEKSSLYHRENNNTTDNVEKHTYDFKDLSGEEITLRPEINSGIARTIIDNNLYNNNPLKYYYYGDVFRYDKPQKDRYREFTQFGFEVIGSNQIIVDTDIIKLAHDIYKGLGVNDITLTINSLGNINDINNYRTELINYFSKYIDDMCDECKKRIINNPLRILDCKNKKDQEIINNAPKLIDVMSKESRNRFERIQQLLHDRNVQFVVDDRFIRGIDYQNDTIFEITSNDKSLGSNNNLCGGGRYDNLYSHLFKRDIPAIGFDFGLERLIKVINSQNKELFDEEPIDIYFICFTEEDFIYCSKICDYLRGCGLRVEYCIKDCSYKKQLKHADKYNPLYTAFIGENERKNNLIDIRDNSNNDRKVLNINDIIKIVNTKNNERQKVKKYGSK